MKESCKDYLSRSESKSFNEILFSFIDEKKVKDSDDIEAIKAATEKLTTTFYSVSEKLYSQAAGQAQGANPGTEGNVNTDENGNVYNADYKVEDDGNK